MNFYKIITTQVVYAESPQQATDFVVEHLTECGWEQQWLIEEKQRRYCRLCGEVDSKHFRKMDARIYKISNPKKRVA